MNPIIQTLVELQETLRGIEDAQRREREMPARLEALDRGLEEAARNLNAARDELSAGQKERRRLEMDVASIEAVISRHQDQLLGVKTNEAYRALQHEIEQERARIRQVEDQILELMERADFLNQRIRLLEGEHGVERQRVEVEKGRVTEAGAAVAGERERLTRRRAELEQRVAPDLLESFLKVARARGGVGIVRAQNELCGGCNVRLRPQVFQEVRRGDRLFTCDSCKRFLYWEEPRPAQEGAAGGSSNGGLGTGALEEGRAPAGS